MDCGQIDSVATTLWWNQSNQQSCQEWWSWKLRLFIAFKPEKTVTTQEKCTLFVANELSICITLLSPTACLCWVQLDCTISCTIILVTTVTVAVTVVVDSNMTSSVLLLGGVPRASSY